MQSKNVHYSANFFVHSSVYRCNYLLLQKNLFIVSLGLVCSGKLSADKKIRPRNVGVRIQLCKIPRQLGESCFMLSLTCCFFSLIQTYRLPVFGKKTLHECLETETKNMKTMVISFSEVFKMYILLQTQLFQFLPNTIRCHIP